MPRGKSGRVEGRKCAVGSMKRGEGNSGGVGEEKERHQNV